MHARLSVLSRAGGAVVLIGWSLPLAAQIALPDAVFQGSVRFETCQGTNEAFAPTPTRAFDLSLDVSVTCPGGINDGAAARVLTTGGAIPALDVQLDTTGPQAGLSARAGAQVRYYLTVERVATAPGVFSVPVLISAAGSASALFTGRRVGDAVATLSIGGPGVSIDRIASVDLRSAFNQSGSDDFTVSQSASLPINSFWSVMMSGSTFSGFGLSSTNAGSSSGQVVVDPTFQIDPTFTQRDAFRLVYSSNLVPEPGGALLLLIGIAVLIAAERLRNYALARSTHQHHSRAMGIRPGGAPIPPLLVLTGAAGCALPIKQRDP